MTARWALLVIRALFWPLIVAGGLICGSWYFWQFYKQLARDWEEIQDVELTPEEEMKIARGVVKDDGS